MTPNQGNALDVIRSIIDRNKGRPFLIDRITGKATSYGSLLGSALTAAERLGQLGLEKGDRVAVLMCNSVNVATLYFGCLFRGVVVVPINPALSEGQVAQVVRASRSKLVIAAPSLTHKLRGVEGVRVVTLAEHGEPGADLDGFEPDDTTVARSKMQPTDLDLADEAIVIFTSGTSAEPKGVVHRIGSLLNNGRLFVEQVGLSPECRFINLLPMTYLGGYYNLLLIPFLSEGSVVISNAFDAGAALDFWKVVAENNVNTLWLVPTIMSLLLELDRGTAGADYCRRNVRHTIVGTAPLPSKVRAAFERKYGVTVCENYGLSETLFISTDSSTRGTRNGGVGALMPRLAVRIVDRNGVEAERTTDGEIEVRTPFLMNGYFDGATGLVEAQSPDTWFPTGDIGRFDEAGELFITGRKKDLIIRGGINISPAGIEQVLYRHPSVIECAVVGLPHNIMGEEIVAVIRRDAESDAQKVKADLEKLCDEHLATIERPSRFVELAEFPKGHTGKIQKAKLRAWLRDSNAESAPLQAPGNRGQKVVSPAHFFQPSRVVGEAVQAMSIKYNNLVYELKQRGEDVTVLSLGEAFFDIPLMPFDDLPFPQLYHYSHSRGVPELRLNLAKYFREQYEVEFDPETEIIVTAGSKIAIHMALMAILNPGDEVLIQEPAWVSYPEQVKLCYGVPVQIPYWASLFEFENFVTNRTRAIIINSPHNPTGKVFRLDELSHLYQLAEKYNLFILSDEAYSDFLLDEEKFVSLGNLDREKRRSIICNSISKNYGISGWRLGYVIANRDLTDQILKVNQHLITCPATILEYYVAKHFFNIIKITKPQISAVVKKRQKLAQTMDEIGLRYLPGTATFYFFVSIEGSRLSSEEFCTRLLNERRISTVPGIGYGKSCDKFIRVSVGTESMERTIAGLRAVRTLIDETRA